MYETATMWKSVECFHDLCGILEEMPLFGGLVLDN